MKFGRTKFILRNEIFYMNLNYLQEMVEHQRRLEI